MGDPEGSDDENEREEKREGPEKLKPITTRRYSPGGPIQAPDFFRLGKNTYNHRPGQVRWLASSKKIEKVVREENTKGKKRRRTEDLEDRQGNDTKRQRCSCVIC